MTIECYLEACPNHPGDEPFCHLPDCTATEQEIKLYSATREIQKLGYTVDDLERDNPYNQWMYES